MKRQFEYRTPDEIAAIGAAPLLDEIGGRLLRQGWKSADIDCMDARQDLSAGIRQRAAGAGERRLLDDACTERLPGHEFHDESLTQAILGSEHVQHLGCRHAASPRRGYQLSLDIQADADHGLAIALGRA